MSWPGGAYNWVLNCGSTQTQGGGVQKLFEPKRVDSLLYIMIEFFNHGIQGTAMWSQLSFVSLLRLVANSWNSVAFATAANVNL